MIRMNRFKKLKSCTRCVKFPAFKGGVLFPEEIDEELLKYDLHLCKTHRVFFVLAILLRYLKAFIIVETYNYWTGYCAIYFRRLH